MFGARGMHTSKLHKELVEIDPDYVLSKKETKRSQEMTGLTHN